MSTLPGVFERNRQWADSMSARNLNFFSDMSKEQGPHSMVIECSDSKIPTNTITGFEPGELFVHRNIANQVIPNDINCLSAIQYAVEVLGIHHIIICGHYGCSGVEVAMDGKSTGLVNYWVRHIKDTYTENRLKIEKLADSQDKMDLLCELNVRQQVRNVGYTSIVQQAWKKGKFLTIHGWIYSLQDGLLKNLGLCASSKMQLEAQKYG